MSLDDYGAFVIFGGSAPIGRAIAARLQMARRAIVIATYHRRVPRPAGTISWTHFDVVDGDVGVVEAAVGKCGQPLRAVFYCCVGVPAFRRTAAEMPLAEWEELLKINCLGFVRAYGGLRGLIRENQASVLALSSDAVRTVRARNGAYAASRAALEAVVKTLAREEASYGVRINALVPLLDKTPTAEPVPVPGSLGDRPEHSIEQPWNRLVTVDEVADIALSVALSDGWRDVTGMVLHPTPRR